MFIKNPNAARILARRPTVKDRQALDFSRLLSPKTNEGGPTPGVSFAELLKIATECCGREIRELTEIKTKAEVKRIVEEVERRKHGSDE